MSASFNPGFEYDWQAVLVVTTTTLTLCAVVLFGLDRPSWMLPAALIGGGIAAVYGEFYDPVANNGLLGVTLTAVPLYLFVVGYRLGVIPSPGVDTDLLFVAGVYALGDMIGYLPMMAVFGYLGATVCDRLRRRVAPPLGYHHGGETRRIAKLTDDAE